jgi:hypothetical protein
MKTSFDFEMNHPLTAASYRRAYSISLADTAMAFRFQTSFPLQTEDVLGSLLPRRSSIFVAVSISAENSVDQK